MEANMNSVVPDPKLGDESLFTNKAVTKTMNSLFVLYNH